MGSSTCTWLWSVSPDPNIQSPQEPGLLLVSVWKVELETEQRKVLTSLREHDV